MERRAIFRIAAAVLAALAAVAWVVAGEGGPRIRFEHSTHDFGTIRSDEPQEVSWPFFNDGDAPLRIVGTRPQCGCTATTLDDAPVPPGGRGTLEVRFDPVGIEGRVRKSLAVMSNDPTRGTVLLSLVAEIIPVEEKVEPGGHPRTAGRSLLAGDCASCHAAPAAGKTGAALYEAVCVMCHAPDGSGVHAPSIRDASYLSSRTDDELAEAIAYGTANPKMPGFSELMGGPLDDAQVRSLVSFMRTWGDGSSSPGR